MEMIIIIIIHNPCFHNQCFWYFKLKCSSWQCCSLKTSDVFRLSAIHTFFCLFMRIFLSNYQCNRCRADRHQKIEYLESGTCQTRTAPLHSAYVHRLRRYLFYTLITMHVVNVLNFKYPDVNSVRYIARICMHRAKKKMCGICEHLVECWTLYFYFALSFEWGWMRSASKGIHWTYYVVRRDPIIFHTR